MKPLNFDYYYGAEADQFTFIRIPRVLINAPHFKIFSMEVKVLYGLMLDRMGLSIKNEWLTPQEVYERKLTTIYLHCGAPKCLFCVPVRHFCFD